jgi:hypothetical protein
VSAPAKLAAFAAMLLVLFGGGALAGGAVGPQRDSGSEGGAGTPRTESAHGGGTDEHDAAPAAARTEGPDHGHGAAAKAAQPVRGLAVAENGLRLVVEDQELRRGRTEELRFSIVDGRRRIVRDFDLEHTKRLHLIVARRDLTGFQHLHPEQQADGSWSVDLRLDEAGSYRVFADFSTAGRAHTLATDLRVDGQADLRPLPAAASTAISDGGYDVRLRSSRARPGEEAELRFAISKDGQTVHTEPYLGAGGHLVALREGDLAFLHVHPTDSDDDQKESAHDDAIAFAATFPTAGGYRLFLQFKHRDRVQTVAFTREVG